MIYLGVFYLQGLGVTKNPQKAVDFFKRALTEDNDNSYAMIFLGICYQKGEGVDQDWDEAINYYQRAINAGDKNAIDCLQTILSLQNFLYISHLNTQKIKAWPKIKCPYLSESPVFDPPVIAGDWRPFTAKEITIHLDKIIVPLQILGLVNNFDGYFGQYGRYLPLNFYKDCNLVDMQFDNPINKNTFVFSAIFNAESAVLLNSEADIIHSLNPYLLTIGDKKSALDYLQFFCSYVHGDTGPFQIISNLNEIPFREEANKDIQNKIKKDFFKPRYIEGDFDKEGWQKFEACVLYKNALYTAIFKVFPNGMIDMENDNPIATGLFIHQRQYDGVFRTPLRSLHD